ncbi:MAG: hupB [Gammaproteobacteria bacterium]|jgi:DNA-binding protein HU-beta|nr:hupB [Gammaproteobacteria bacterium]
MNKTDLIETVAGVADLSKTAATEAVEAIVRAITEALCKGEQVAITGFGTFLVGSRAERTGRNPQTGKAITIAASKTPRFKPGKGLKEAVNGTK